MKLTASHNLNDAELVTALTALSDSSGIGEDLRKAIKAKACDDTPKEPRYSAMRHLYQLFLQMNQEAARDIERYAREIMGENG